ncbi:MAG: serine--tRNA ligase, partial [Lachnospiraceae bacterium]|nr:serine--tRNA ligase [Lachnospiraceae bacterium]
MIDIKFLREEPDKVRQNIRNKFQEDKLHLVDEVIALDEDRRKTQQAADDLRQRRNTISKQIGALMGQGKKEEAEELKKQVAEFGEELEAAQKRQTEL